MKYDLTVKDIKNVYYRERDYWKRDVCQPRGFDAVVLFVAGEIEYYFNDRTIVARQGDLLFLPGNVPYSGKWHSGKVAFFVLDFTSATSNEYAALGAPCVVTPSDYEGCLAEFQNAVDVWSKQMTNVNFKIKSFLFSLLGELNVREGSDSFDTQMKELLAYVADHFTDPRLSVKGLCEKFFISESQLRRNIRKATGAGTNDYILSLRINKAKSELSDTNKSVKRISLECGFSSQYYFSRCFLKTVGVSPSKYRTLTCI